MMISLDGVVSHIYVAPTLIDMILNPFRCLARCGPKAQPRVSCERVELEVSRTPAPGAHTTGMRRMNPTALTAYDRKAARIDYSTVRPAEQRRCTT